jgi:hypothetical protein
VRHPLSADEGFQAHGVECLDAHLGKTPGHWYRWAPAVGLHGGAEVVLPWMRPIV